MKVFLKDFLNFVLARVDKAGHEHCWGCKEYYDELEVIDGYIQGIMKALNETKTSQGILNHSYVLPLVGGKNVNYMLRN